jgi:hypothetical protein
MAVLLSYMINIRSLAELPGFAHYGLIIRLAEVLFPFHKPHCPVDRVALPLVGRNSTVGAILNLRTFL